MKCFTPPPSPRQVTQPEITSCHYSTNTIANEKLLKVEGRIVGIRVSKTNKKTGNGPVTSLTKMKLISFFGHLTRFQYPE